MFAGTTDELELQLSMMSKVIRDDDTDEIIGIRDDATADEKRAFEAMMAEMESDIPQPK